MVVSLHFLTNSQTLISIGKKGSCSINNGGCTHKCVQLALRHICRCKTGHRIARNGRDCIDINECEKLGSCSHKCQNTVGSFKCSCANGYVKDPIFTNICKATGMKKSPDAFFFQFRNTAVNSCAPRYLHIADVQSQYCFCSLRQDYSCVLQTTFDQFVLSLCLDEDPFHLLTWSKCIKYDQCAHVCTQNFDFTVKFPNQPLRICIIWIAKLLNRKFSLINSILSPKIWRNLFIWWWAIVLIFMFPKFDFMFLRIPDHLIELLLYILNLS